MEKEFKIVIDNVPAVLFKGYRDGTVDFYDNKIETITGYSKEEFRSRRLNWIDLIFADLILEEDHNQTKQVFIQALKTNKAYVREYRIRAKAGNVIWVHERSLSVQNFARRWRRPMVSSPGQRDRASDSASPG